MPYPDSAPIAAKLQFYCNTLGFIKLAEYDDGQGERLIWVIPQPVRHDDRATQIALYAPPDSVDPRIGAASGLVFTAADIEATDHELKDRGVPCVKDLVRHPDGQGGGDQEAQFLDPDGNRFLLHT